MNRRTIFSRAVVCLAILLTATALASQTGRIRGRVVDAKTREPLVGANVVIEGTDLGAATDAKGEYLIANVPVGRVSVTASYISYQTVRKTDVLVIVDQTITEDFALSAERIEMGVVEVKSTPPPIVRTVAATSQTMGSEEIAKLPVATLADIVRLQTGVVVSATQGQHIRGGRPDEVAYFVDGVATSDPLYGYQAARVNPGATAEVVVISGGFDAEYGEAMSGIVQVITKEGRENFSGRLGWVTDEFMPGPASFGDNRIEASLGGPLPGLQRLRYFLSGELYFAEDYRPLRYKLPHQNRQDYKFTGKLTYSLPLNEGLRLSADGFIAREQNELYPSDRESENHLGFKYNLDHYLSRRERARKGNVSANHMLTKNTFYTARVSYFYNQRVQAVRDLEREANERNWRVRFWEDYIFKAEDSVLANDSVLFRPMPGYVQQSQVNTNNPWGVYNLFYGSGDYRYFLLHWSEVVTLKGDITHNIGKVHEIKAGIETRLNSLHRRYNSLPWDPNPFVDSYDVNPVNAAAYVQDRMDFEDLVVRAGLRLDYLDPSVRKRANPSNIEDTSTVAASLKYKVSPRLGVSFPITTTTKFRLSYGHFYQTPAYHFLYDNISTAAYSRGNQIIGNPDLLAQQTIAYELGLEQQFSPLVVGDFTAYYKDIFDLMGTRFQPAVPTGFFPLVNEEYGSVRGFEVSLRRLLDRYWSARVTYGLSIARGTASSTYEWYYERYRYGTDPVTGMQMEPPRRDYALEFDQTHNTRLSLSLDVPGDVAFVPARDLSGSLLFSVASGLPYTPREVGARGLNAGRPTAERNSARMPGSFTADLNAAKRFRIGPLRLGLTLVVTNLFNNQNITWVYGATGRPDDDGYAATLSPLGWSGVADITNLNTSLYNPVRDRNHDGYITDEEEYIAFKMAWLDFVDNPINWDAPRQVKLGVALEF